MKADTGQSLIGCWLVERIDQTPQCVRGIAGLPGEHVEFDADGFYRVDLAAAKPSQYKYSTSAGADPAALDVWVSGCESLACHCIWRVSGDTLTICVALDGGERPTDFRRDDNLLWCLRTYARSELPKRRGKARRRIPVTEIPKTSVTAPLSLPRDMARIADAQPAGPATAAQIDEFERYIGHVLPPAYRDFLLSHNGGRPVPDAFVLRGEHSEQENVAMCFFPLRDLALGNVKVEAFDDLRVWPLHCAWDDLQSDLENFYETEFDSPLLPIGTDGSSNYICLVLAGSGTGAVVFLDHEMGEATPLAAGFPQFLQSLRVRQRTDYHPVL